MTGDLQVKQFMSTPDFCLLIWLNSHDMNTRTEVGRRVNEQGAIPSICRNNFLKLLELLMLKAICEPYL